MHFEPHRPAEGGTQRPDRKDGATRLLLIASLAVAVLSGFILLVLHLRWSPQVESGPMQVALLLALLAAASATALATWHLGQRQPPALVDPQNTARRLDDERRRSAVLRRVLAAVAGGNMSLGLRRLLSQVCRTIGVQAGGVALVCDKGSIGAMICTYRLPPPAGERSSALLATLRRWMEHAPTSDGSAGTLTAPCPALAEWGLSGRLLVVPLNADGHLHGAMVLVVHERFERLHPAHQLFIDDIAISMAMATKLAQQTRRLERTNVSLEEHVRDRTFEMEVLQELSQVMGRTLDYPKMLRLLVEHSHWVVSCDVAACLSITPQGGPAEITIRPLRPIESTVRREVESTMQRAADTAAPQGSGGIRTRITEPPDPSAPTVGTLASTAVIPVYSAHRHQLTGLLFVGSETPNAFPTARVRLLTKVVEQATHTVGQLRALLSSEQKRLEQVVATLPGGVLLLDKDHRARLVNPQATRCLEALGEVVDGRVIDSIGGTLLEDLLDEARTHESVEVCTRGDPTRTFGLRASPVTDGPEAGGHVVTIHELTKERRDQARLEEEGRLAAVGQLAAGIAHDFNNLLTSVIGNAEMLLLDGGLKDDSLEDVTTIRDQGRRAAQMIQQILDFSRRSNPGHRSVDLARVLRKTYDLLVRTIPEHIRLTLELEAGLFPVMANTTQLQQVLTNLAVNARDAMPDGGRIQLSLSRHGPGSEGPLPLPEMRDRGWAVVRITDTGIGMSPAVAKRIFEPFFTTKPVGKGTGLGLAQTYGIVQQHDGHIDVKTRSGEGTTFTLWLPLSRRKSSETGDEIPSLATLATGDTALVVEDDPQVLVVLRRMIGRMGYRVATASNGRDGIAVFERLRQEIRLVITDLTMPEMSGIEFYQRLRALDDHVPVVVLSGYPFGHLIDDDAMRGVGAWVTKPPTLSALTKAMNDARGPTTDISDT